MRSPVQSGPVRSSPVQSGPVRSSPVQSGPVQKNTMCSVLFYYKLVALGLFCYDCVLPK